MTQTQREEPKWRPPLYRHRKWWNLALGVVILVGGLSIIGPLFNPHYRTGLWGNVVSSAWQIMAGSLLGWIVYKRLRAERFKRAMPTRWAEPFTEMNVISKNLCPLATGEAVELRNVLNDMRNALAKLAVSGRQKGILFGQFFEIEQVANIDRCCDAAERLAGIDDGLSDAKFMSVAILAILDLHACSLRIRGYGPSLETIQALHAAYQKWSSLDFNEFVP